MFLDCDSKKWLLDLFGANVKFSEPMAKHTSLRVGGPAKVFVTPDTLNALGELICWSMKKYFPCFIIGGGTNLLVADKGLEAIVINLTKCLKKIEISDKSKDVFFVTAMAGVKMQSLCSFAIERGLEGMNFALGIPGTVGGGIMMNAGTAEGTIENVLVRLNILLLDGRTVTLDRSNFDFDCRKLSLKSKKNDYYNNHPIIISGCFRLHRGDPNKIKEKAKAILLRRKKSQPTSLPSAGCFFKNPDSGKSAGELIELTGLKGMAVGGARISAKHANFIINEHRASAADILALSKLVQERVFNKFNVSLQPEVIIVGT